MNSEPNKRQLGGIVHTYQKYDPRRFPSPTQPGPDVVSHAFEHWLMYGSRRELTEEELSRAIHLDPSQIQGLGPSLDGLIAMLLERKRKILETYETETVQRLAAEVFQKHQESIRPPRRFRDRYRQAVKHKQLYQLERLWYAIGDDQSPFARNLIQLIERLGDEYEIDDLASRYRFHGKVSMDIPQALAIKEELIRIDELLKQLEEARETAQIGIIDLDALSEFAEPGEIGDLQALKQFIEDYTRELAERQGLQREGNAFRLTPQAYRIFQGRLLERIFSDLQAARTGRHRGPIVGEGAVEMPQTKPYEFGDSLTNMDIVQTMMNAMLRDGVSLPVRIKADDIEIHRTRNTPKCATVVIMDMSGSMRYGGQYINVKRMALALDGLIRREFPGDFLRFVEMYTFAKLRPASEIVELMPKPVTISDPFVQLRADMSRDDLTEAMVHPHFTNIQHGLQLARQLLAGQETPNRQIVLITDGLPTAHFDKSWLFLLYPPDPRTESATLREAGLCQRENITINLFLIPSWTQSEEDVRFAHRLAETTQGRVFFTAGRDLDRFVVWDYVHRKKEIIS